MGDGGDALLVALVDPFPVRASLAGATPGANAMLGERTAMTLEKARQQRFAGTDRSARRRCDNP